jgi:lysyl-tRNA synthetase, class II
LRGAALRAGFLVALGFAGLDFMGYGLAMDREPVNSSAIASVGFSLAFGIETTIPWLDLPGTLEIEFTKGDVYQYLAVPTSVYKQLMSAPSAGQYFNQAIKNSYAYA